MLKITGKGITPQRSFNSAGYDLFACLESPVVIPSGKRACIPTGIHTELDTEQNIYLRIAPRSGLALNHGIDVFAGVVDKDYRGEIKVILFNSGEKDFEVKHGDKIAQMILETYHVFPIQLETSLSETKRGSNGFGSTDSAWEQCI